MDFADDNEQMFGMVHEIVDVDENDTPIAISSL